MNLSELVTEKGVFCDGDWIEKKDQNPNGEVRLIQLADIGVCDFKDKSAKFLTKRRALELNCTFLKKGDILIARLPEPLGRACIFPLEGEFVTAVDIAIVRPYRVDTVNTSYLMYLLNSPQIRSQIKLYESGTTRKRISRKNLDKITFDLPPLEEQARIVARIEELFSQLESGVETLKQTKEQLAVYRQAVLKEAFDSLATKGKQYSIKDVCHEIKVGIVIKPAQYYTDAEHGIKAFRSANVREFRINDSDWVYLSQEGHAQNKRSEIHTGDVLIVRSGYPGTACVVNDKFNGCNAIDILIAVPKTELITSEYLCAYTNSPHGRKLVSEKKRGVAQAHLNVGGYSKMQIVVPSIEEQKQIVSIIESRLSMCDCIEQTVDAALQQAEALRQSILKEAFEGGL